MHKSMAFVSKNELTAFSFEDCEISEFNLTGIRLTLTVEALIILAGNSQNDNCTDSYAGTAQMSFDDFELKGIYREGYKYYDADGRLIKAVEDETVNATDYEELFKSFEGAYLVKASKTEDDTYLMVIELADEIGAASDSYRIEAKATGVVVKWDRYLNRVGR